MSVIQAVLLGFLQGVTEFLPISSSGHLVLARSIMTLEEIPTLFDIILHLATLTAVVWAFRKRIGVILLACFRFFRQTKQIEVQEQLQILIRLILASGITAIIGVSIQLLKIELNPSLVAICMLGTACILLPTCVCKGSKQIKTMGWLSVALLGAAQGISVMPGISRSGISISTGLFLGLNRKSAGEFSFLLSIPAILGAFLLSLKDMETLAASVPLSALLLGFCTALFAGYACLRLLLWIVSFGKLWIFALYLIPMGLWILM